MIITSTSAVALRSLSMPSFASAAAGYGTGNWCTGHLGYPRSGSAAAMSLAPTTDVVVRRVRHDAAKQARPPRGVPR